MTKSIKNKKPKIGITISVTALNTLWSNGLNQNVHSLYTIINKSQKFCVYLIVQSFSGDASDDIKKFKLSNPNVNIAILDETNSIKEKFDLIIEAGVVYRSIIIESIKRKSPKTKFVLVKYGNNYFMLSEEILNDAVVRDHVIYEHPRDAVWASPHFEDTFEWIRASTRSKYIRTAPYIWTPMFLHKSISDLGLTVEDLRPTKKMNVGVLEPNINAMKTCIIPITIIDELYCKKPDILGECSIFNSKFIIKNKVAASLFLHLKSVIDKKIIFDLRYSFAKIFSSYSDILLSHQHMCGLNYTYLEALYLGIPFVHNSTYLRDTGYYYKEFSISEGTRALESACADGGKFSNYYKMAAKEYLWKYSIDNPTNINEYSELIEEVLSS